MRTLVIHPEDPSTDFLKGIYENIDCRVLRKGNDFINESLKTEILQHDRIIMLGHGTRFGLMSLADHSYIVSHLLGKILKEKQCICIWCDADEYVRRHDLICQIYTGMFISEMREAVMYKIESEDLEEKIRQSNELFAGLVNRYIDCEDISSRVVPEYILHDNPVADFNRERIYPCQEPIREAWPDEILRKELAEFPDYPEDDME